MAAPVRKDEEVELQVDSLAYGGNGVARLDGFVIRPPRAARRPRPGPGDEGEARLRRGARRRLLEGRRSTASRRRARPLPGLRRLPFPGSRLRGAGGGEGGAGARRADADRRDRGRAGRADPAGRVAVLVPQQARVLVYADAVRARARLPQGRPLGRGAGGRALLADDRSRQRDRNVVRDWAREENLEAYDQAEPRLPASSRLPRGAAPARCSCCS